MLHVFVMHGNEILYVLGIQDFFQEELAAVGDAKGIPADGGGFVHDWIFFGDTGGANIPSGQACTRWIIRLLIHSPSLNIPITGNAQRGEIWSVQKLCFDIKRKRLHNLL